VTSSLVPNAGPPLIDRQLHISIAMNHLEASLWLIQMAPHPCLLDIMNDDSQTALHMAVASHASCIVRRLVLAGANTSLRTVGGNTALHLACAVGDLASAKALLEPLSFLERNWLANAVPKRDVMPLGQNLEIRNYIGESALFLLAARRPSSSTSLAPSPPPPSSSTFPCDSRQRHPRDAPHSLGQALVRLLAHQLSQRFSNRSQLFSPSNSLYLYLYLYLYHPPPPPVHLHSFLGQLN
jgi:hypothetical protein